MTAFDEFLEFENKNYETLKKYRFAEADLMMWPYMRNIVLEGLVGYERNPEVIDYDVIPIKLFSLNTLTYILEVLKSFLRPKRRKEFLFFDEDRSNVPDSEGIYCNPLFDPYAELVGEENVAFFERSTQYMIRRPRKMKGVICLDYMLIPIFLKTKFSRISLETRRQIDGLEFFLREELGENRWNAIDEKFKTKIEILAKRLPLQQKAYRKLLRKISPKYIFINAGCYSRGHILREAKRLGVTTCEIQHGLISSNHYAYNYCEKFLKDADFAELFPDYFFAYGEYFAKILRAPTKAVVVGSPTKVQEAKEKDSILFIVSCDSREKMKGVIRSFCKSPYAMQYRLIYRPHPAEIDFLEKDKEFAKENNLIFSPAREEPVDGILARAKAVVGGYSTVLYEAVRYGATPFLIRTRFSEDGGFPDSFRAFEEAEDFLEKFGDTEKNEDDFREDIYAENWEENVKNFLKG